MFFNKKILNNLKIGLYSFSLLNMSLNPENVYANDCRIVSFQEDEQMFRIYDKDSGSFISYNTLINEGLSLDRLYIEVASDFSDFSFLKSCPNLSVLEIYSLEGSIDLSFLDEMDNLSKLTIYEKVPFSNDNLEHIRRCKKLNYLSLNTAGCLDVSWLLELENLKDLMLYNVTYKNINRLSSCRWLETLKIKVDEEIPDDLFASMTFLKKLILEVSDTCNIDYQKLTFLDELEFLFSKSYTVAVDFTTEDYNILKASDVKITALDKKKDIMDEICSVNNKLDKIVDSLRVLPDDTDQEKLDKILIYVLDCLAYDQKLINSKYTYILGYKHYERGLLYSSLEDSKNAICGNYASLVSALAKRVGLKCIYLQNDNHAWNVVKVDDVYYGVDATFLDCEYSDAADRLRLGNHSMDWYLVPLNELNDAFHTSNKKVFLGNNKVLKKSANV